MESMSDYLRGHEIEHDGVWVYCDTGEPTAGNRRDRCGFCGLPSTPDGHDGCLGALPGVVNACCGHGVEAEAYVQFVDGWLGGAAALGAMVELIKTKRGHD